MQSSVAADRRGETALLYLLMLSYALFTTLIGAVLTRLIAEFALPLAQGGIFVSTQNAGCFVGILLSGALVDRFRKSRLILLAFGCFTAALLSAPLTAGLYGYLAVLFVAGLAAKLLDALLNTRISSMHPETRGTHITLLHGAYGVGSLCGPLLAGGALDAGLDWRMSYFAVGLVSAALFVVYALVLRSGRTAPETVRSLAKRPESGTVMSPRVLCLCATIMLYSGYEVGVNNWLPAYLEKEAGSTPVAAAFSVSIFWLGLIVGRLICSAILRRVDEHAIICGGSALGGLSLAAGLLAGGEGAAYVGAFGAGLLSGSVPPLIFTLGFTWHPTAQGRVSLLLFIAITVGAIVFPWILGEVAGYAGLRVGMYLDAALLLTTAGIVAVMPRRG